MDGIPHHTAPRQQPIYRIGRVTSRPVALEEIDDEDEEMDFGGLGLDLWDLLRPIHDYDSRIRGGRCLIWTTDLEIVASGGSTGQCNRCRCSGYHCLVSSSSCLVDYMGSDFRPNYQSTLSNIIFFLFEFEIIACIIHLARIVHGLGVLGSAKAVHKPTSKRGKESVVLVKLLI